MTVTVELHDLDAAPGGHAMAVVDVEHLSFKYGKVTALRDATLTVPEGALYALLGPNGSGKTTLLQLLLGLRRPSAGRVRILDADPTRLSIDERARVGYVAEGQSLPGWMRLEQLEAYLAPLYPSWDAALARELRERFGLDPSRRIKTLSRGEYMKAALLCALAPRPRLLIMDEPFTGMDALVKDDLVRGLLASAGAHGWTIVVTSHDIGELEMLADWIGFLANGRMVLSEPMETMQRRFKRVEATLDSGQAREIAIPTDAIAVDRSTNRLSYLATQFDEGETRRAFGGARIEVRDATLREVFVGLARAEREHRGASE